MSHDMDTIAAVVAAAPESARGIMARALSGDASPRAAIKAKCLECCGYVHADIADCRAVRCQLHAYRPFQSKAAA
jgi:hypothetical protein